MKTPVPLESSTDTAESAIEYGDDIFLKTVSYQNNNVIVTGQSGDPNPSFGKLD